MTSIISSGDGLLIDPVGGNAEKSGAGEGGVSPDPDVEALSAPPGSAFETVETMELEPVEGPTRTRTLQRARTFEGADWWRILEDGDVVRGPTREELSLPGLQVSGGGQGLAPAGPDPAPTGTAEASVSSNLPGQGCESPGSRVNRTTERLFRGEFALAWEAARQGKVLTADARCWPVWAYLALLVVLGVWWFGRSS